MAYDEKLADRIRQAVGRRAGVTEKQMFGGIAFMIDGKMFCGIQESNLMARVGPELHESSLAEPHVRPMDFTGRPMVGYVYVAPAGLKTDAVLAKWVERCLTVVSSLPAKKPRKAAPRQKKAPTRRK